MLALANKLAWDAWSALTKKQDQQRTANRPLSLGGRWLADGVRRDMALQRSAAAGG